MAGGRAGGDDVGRRTQLWVMAGRLERVGGRRDGQRDCCWAAPEMPSSSREEEEEEEQEEEEEEE